MLDWQKDLEALRLSFEGKIKTISDLDNLEQFRLEFVGKKGLLTAFLRNMGALPSEERPKVGQEVNKLRDKIEAELLMAKSHFKKLALEKNMKNHAIDVSIPVSDQGVGSFHPLTRVTNEVTDIFVHMGYSIADGPEIEWVKYNFDLLRIEEGHPAREEKDTFYVQDDMILRTQTSPVQIRVMENQKPPIKIVSPGKVYRPDTPDATHSPVFHQIEGLVVDKGVAMSDLVGTLKLFAAKLFGEDTKIRLRPHHFPFTEPSCEVDVTCWTCKGKKCRTCKQEGFVEVLGAGMVHPWVLEQSGIDPNIYSGFAFGIGVERTAMARYGVEDIRYFYENNMQFLNQFK